MFERIDPRSPTPLYAQIAARIRVAIAAGELLPGQALLSVRQLAKRIRVNPATVVQAYRDLESEGFVTRKHGAGTFVQEVSSKRREDERTDQAQRLVQVMLTEAARLGISRRELTKAVGKEFNEAIA